ncbi:MAG: SIMPL domain-containing protein [Balneolaceae bacterium]
MIVRTLFTLILALISLQLFAQSHSDNSPKISISSSAEVYVPVDLVNFSINISISEIEADKAFQIHKEREAYLARLLTDMDIDEENISYQPIAIRPNRQRDEEIHTITNQRIDVELSDLSQLNEMQRLLINNKFDNFSGSFSSTKIAEAEELALEKAVEKARHDAEILAKASGKSLGSVKSIDYASDVGFKTTMNAEMVRSSYDSPSMSDFAQTIPVEKRINIVFELLE